MARMIIGQHLAACVNLVHSVTSIYSWKDRIAEDNEIMLLIKTTQQGYPALEQAIIDHHPYDTPEVIAVDVTRGSEEYLDWISQCVKSFN